MTDGLVLDFSNISTRWKLEVQRANTAMERARKRLNAVADDISVPDEDVDAAWDALEETTRYATDMMCKAVVDVPRAWLVTDAPKQINWREAGAFQWVRADYETQLANAIVERMQNPAGKSG